MRLSISIVKTESGYTPRLVLENPREFRIIPSDITCPTWKEAWTAGGIFRETIRSKGL
jgi:hypothetical protein